MMRLLFVLTLLVAGAANAQDRIVSAGGDISEIIHAFGAGDRLVGVDSTSNYPPSMEEIDQIGYVRALSAEGVLSLTPDILIGARDTGPENVVSQLQAAGLTVALAPDIPDDADSVTAKISFVGALLGEEEKAAELVATYTADMADIAEIITQIDGKPRVMFILAIQDGAPLVGGDGSSAEAIIELAGGVNAAAGVPGYKPMNSEAIIAANPDIVLMMNGRSDAAGGKDEVLGRPDLSQTNAGKSGSLIEMDGMLMLGFGIRTPSAVRELAQALHPEEAGRLGQ